MVYGEYAQENPLHYVNCLQKLLQILWKLLIWSTGAEAIDGSLKLAKRYTGREEIVSFKNSYHGNTHGALSVSGNENHKENFALYCQWFLSLNLIMKMILIKSQRKQLVSFWKPFRGSRFLVPDDDYLIKLKKRCEEVGAL
jgi:acetylornithine/succinyldiaminopimelate/putrescine aminotransferase